MEAKRMYRSRQDKIIAGVCGGIAEFYNIDPVWVRLIAVLLVLAKGLGIILYIVLWIVMPKNPSQKSTRDTKAEIAAAKFAKKAATIEQTKPGMAAKVFGIILVVAGMIFLLQNLLHWFDWQYGVAVVLILLGMFLLFRRTK